MSLNRFKDTMDDGSTCRPGLFPRELMDRLYVLAFELDRQFPSAVPGRLDLDVLGCWRQFLSSLDEALNSD